MHDSNIYGPHQHWVTLLFMILPSVSLLVKGCPLVKKGGALYLLQCCGACHYHTLPLSHIITHCPKLSDFSSVHPSPGANPPGPRPTHSAIHHLRCSCEKGNGGDGQHEQWGHHGQQPGKGRLQQEVMRGAGYLTLRRGRECPFTLNPRTRPAPHRQGLLEV